MNEIRTFYYEEGNTVRRVQEAAPEIITRREQERKEKQERRRRSQARRKAAAMRRNKIYTAYLATAVIVLCGLFVGYVNLQTSITTTMGNISTLEGQISELKADNNATESHINTSTNLNDVKTAAINNLGMVYAGSDQIVYYDMENTDYMSQYNDIP